MRGSVFARCRAVFLAAAAAVVLVASAFAQTDVTTSRISGTVQDNDGRSLPGATVEGKNQETGLTATAVTRSDGFYQLLNLPSGLYTITASLSGFQTATHPNVRLILGSAPTVDFRLPLSRVSEAITVTSAIPVVEVTNTAASTTIQTEQLKNLPIAGRDFTNLVLLTPEARKEPERQNVSISGQRGINTNITVDGVEYDNAFFGGSVASAEGRAPLSLSEESIKELTVIRNGASVEFGPSGGGYINVITKSGTNQFHGSGFYFWQPQSTTAKFVDNGDPKQLRDPFDQKKKQYGASFGGPILQDRLFFFGSYDQQKQDRSVNINSPVLDADIFAKYPALASDPTYVQTTDGRVVFGRLDFQATSSQRFMVRGNYAQYEGANGTSASQNQTVGHNGIETMQAHSYVGTYSGQFGASLLNDFNAQYTLEQLPRLSKDPELPEIQLQSPSATYGSVSFLPIPENLNDRITFGDTMTYLWKNHVSKFGAEYDKTSVNQIFKGNWRGVYIFPDKAALLAGNWSQYRQFIGLGGRSVDEAGRSSFKQKEYAVFLQDQWFVTPHLTVTAGVRYERLDNPGTPILNPSDVNPNGSFNLTGKIADQTNKWSPRFGISWSPDPKTVVRLSAGRFWSRTPGLLFAQIVTSNGVRSSSLTLFPTDPGVPGRGAAFDATKLAPLDPSKAKLPPPGVFTMTSDFKDPKTDRVSLGVDREVFRNTAASLEGTYAKATNLERLRDVNLVYDGTFSTINGQPRFKRPDPYYTSVKQYVSDAESKYYGITASVRHQFAQRLIVFASGTWSQDRDNDSNERNFAGTQSEDGYNLNGSYGYAVRDQRWKVSASATWSTPFWGIGLAGSYRYTTGQPYTATTSADANNDGFFTDRPTINGVHFARSSFRQPNFRSLDVRVSKTFGIGPVELSVTADCFNCTNEANPSVSNTTWGNGQTPLATFGLANNVTLFPRTLQFGGRIAF